MKFRKKPVVIEAFQYKAGMKDFPKWAVNVNLTVFKKNNYLIINTLEGQMRAHPGDWIIKGINGELYPCKPDIFAKTYESIDEVRNEHNPIASTKEDEMKKLVEIEGSGLESLMGEVITVFCCRYIYTGKLIGVSDDCVELEDPSIIYETGPFDQKDWQDAQKLPHKTWFVARSAIESFGVMK